VQLQQLIEGLLNYHRAQESVGRLELTAVRFDEVVEQVLDDHRLAILARGIRADLRLDPVILQADEEKLRAVAANLVSNAIKYSPDEGMISFALRREGDEVVFDVRDAGPGIPLEDHDRIFDWFYQAKTVHHGRVRGAVWVWPSRGIRGRSRRANRGREGRRCRRPLRVTLASGTPRPES